MAETGTKIEVTRQEIEDFYSDYYEALDKLQLEDWPEFFVEDCVYRIIPRENYERNFRLATLGAESRGMLRDRVMGLIKTQVYAPRYYRRFPGPLKIRAAEGDEIPVEHNLLMVQTLVDQPSEIVLCGRCYDRLTRSESKLLLKRRDVVFDSEMILNSLIYPA
ncbi:aromatic-ring-hydroxylating dioxygenase subunit beta [Henriciella aquimarina]|uniref:aromatic-ring-hydroxylating dioxygenase subunit beta n=1 Tax=Henriciella aquimarina TaxID=545261 RepID=UPI000A05EB58|nr:aromatic-ring-hydroxylating dioxygenase subunit beta [Henriciella aquimarina]